MFDYGEKVELVLSGCGLFNLLLTPEITSPATIATIPEVQPQWLFGKYTYLIKVHLQPLLT